jgi:hypothetical protein
VLAGRACQPLADPPPAFLFPVDSSKPSLETTKARAMPMGLYSGEMYIKPMISMIYVEKSPKQRVESPKCLPLWRQASEGRFWLGVKVAVGLVSSVCLGVP